MLSTSLNIFRSLGLVGYDIRLTNLSAKGAQFDPASDHYDIEIFLGEMINVYYRYTSVKSERAAYCFWSYLMVKTCSTLISLEVSVGLLKNDEFIVILYFEPFSTLIVNTSSSNVE